ncbi:MAG: sensor histidine kinase [Nitrospinota bacterium]
MKSPGLKTRLTFWYSGVMAGLLVAVSLVVYAAVRHQLYANLDGSLRAAGKALASVDRPQLTSPPASLFSRLFPDLPTSRLFDRTVQVLDLAGEIRERSLSLGGAQVRLSRLARENALKGRSTLETVQPPGRAPIRVYTQPVVRSGRVVNFVQVAASYGEINRTLRRLALILLGIVPSAVVLAGLGGWTLARRALRPVDEVAAAARRITAERLNERIARPASEDELARLVDTLNAMIARLEAAFDRVREFSADASHELKTPLTILRGEVEVLLSSERTPEEYQRGLLVIMEEVQRMGGIVEDLLTLAKADLGATQLHFAPVDLGDLVGEVFEAARTLPEAEGKRFTLSRRDPLVIEGDADRIRQMVMNLVVNAFRYTFPGGKVDLSLRGTNGRAQISVSDSGIGIAERDVGRIFDRFYRTAEARGMGSEGSGLGLNICKWIAESHKGTIRVKSRRGVGSTFTVELPLDGAARS